MILRIARRLFGKGCPPRQDILVEDNTSLDGCELFGPISIGYRSYANHSLLRNVAIGRFCSIGRRCSIGAALHDMNCFSTHSSAASDVFVRDPQTLIGNDVWIGDNVVVVAGLSIGDGAVIGAGAIVTHDVEPYSIVVGVPARLMRPRFSAQHAAALLESQWWQFGDEAAAAAGPGASPQMLLSVLERTQLTPMPSHFQAWLPNS